MRKGPRKTPKTMGREALVVATYFPKIPRNYDIIDAVLVKPGIMTQAQTKTCQADILECFGDSNRKEDVKTALKSREVIELARESDEVDEVAYMLLEGKFYSYVNYSLYREEHDSKTGIGGPAPKEDDFGFGD